MTPEEIDQIPACRDLDLLIAEKVMGWTDIDKTNDVGQDFVGWPPEPEREYGYQSYVPHYSTEIAAAWLVVEKLKEQKYSVTIYCVGDRRHGHLGQGKEWGCQIYHHERKPNHAGSCDQRPHECTGFFIFASSETSALTICRATLKTVMGGKE